MAKCNFEGNSCVRPDGNCSKCTYSNTTTVEYITKKQALENFENAYQSSEDKEEFSYYYTSFIECIPPADVVERSEYEKLELSMYDWAHTAQSLLEENNKMKEVLSGHYEIKYNNLLSKINEAIGKIEKESFNMRDGDGEWTPIEVVDFDIVSKVLRNIGE